MNHSLFTPIIQKFRNIGWQFVPTSSYSRIRKIQRKNLKEDTSSVIEYNSENMPVQMENPYQKDRKLCVLCKYEIKPDYKNTRLLSQFVSRFTGKLYDRHITGLCKKQQRNVQIEIIKAHRAAKCCSTAIMRSLQVILKRPKDLASFKTNNYTGDLNKWPSWTKPF